MIIPIRDSLHPVLRYQGSLDRKPWHYDVCAIIPNLSAVEQLRLSVQTLRTQTLSPYIVIIDTGSSEAEMELIRAMRAPDLEVHEIKLHGVRHASDPVAYAMDLGFSLCRSRFAYCTHSDVFLRRPGYLHDLVQASQITGVAGYRLSPRQYPGWEKMVGHTSTMFDLRVTRKLNLIWCMEAYFDAIGVPPYAQEAIAPNVPDTEFNINRQLVEAEVVPEIVGTEENDELTADRNLYHVRSFASVQTYTPPGGARDVQRREWWEKVRRELQR